MRVVFRGWSEDKCPLRMGWEAPRSPQIWNRWGLRLSRRNRPTSEDTDSRVDNVSVGGDWCTTFVFGTSEEQSVLSLSSSSVSPPRRQVLSALLVCVPAGNSYSNR
ncbi:Hypothetical protein NTJ_07717 [Nesidiocoris tenuis]|uniref:Uncharacterized protein n=1 Tax=Nesidiocoris tenuis TaxID=355587 RepID=A0ABN7AS67_9HEMI|nr:Hypothetical protein NTJ_07717 [Nesidiocoris tenuis]